MDLKLSQKDVAQKINEKPSILQDYESGKAIPNPQILGKLERALGVKLRGVCCPRPRLRFRPRRRGADARAPQARTLGRSWRRRKSRNLAPP